MSDLSHATPPERRSLPDRPRAPRPPRMLRGGAHGPVYRVLSRLWRWLYPRPAGRWLRDRLERQLALPRVTVRLARASAGLDGLRIAFLSDLHAGAILQEREMTRLLERVSRQRPDLVILGGDLVDQVAQDLLCLARGLAGLDPPLGTFAAPGNHDYVGDASLKIWRDVLSQAGVVSLINRGQRVERGREGLWVAGLDDASLGRPDLERALCGCRPDEPILLISHQPDLFLEAAHAGVDLQLSGHTHGGQIRLGGLAPWARSHSRLGYRHGLFEDRGAQLYVGCGAGVTLLPIRVGTLPEVPLIELRSAGPSPSPS